jgi:hypothetical protein
MVTGNPHLGLGMLRGRGQRRADDYFVAVDLAGPWATDRSLEHRLPGRRRDVMNDWQPPHARS